MEKRIKVFENQEFGRLRTMEIDAAPWFVGKDVATALGYSDTTQALRKHVDAEDKLTRRFDGSGQGRNMTIINESGLYALILSSKLEGAKKFKRWVTSEVLPSIRKHGGYIAGQETLTDDELLAKALLVAQSKIKEREEKIAALVEENGILKPKADYCNKVLQSRDLIPITAIAKDYGMSGTALNKILKEEGVQYKLGNQWVLKQQYARKGYTGSVTNAADGYWRTHAWVHTYRTQAGRLFIYQLHKKKGIVPIMEQISA